MCSDTPSSKVTKSATTPLPKSEGSNKAVRHLARYNFYRISLHTPPSFSQSYLAAILSIKMSLLFMLYLLFMNIFRSESTMHQTKRSYYYAVTGANAGLGLESVRQLASLYDETASTCNPIEKGESSDNVTAAIKLKIFML